VKPAPAGPCWLVVRLPRLALDLYLRGAPERRVATAVSDTARGRERIVDCNAAARAAGVAAGMPLTAARSLLNELRVVARDPVAEAGALERLAAWSYQYSSQVCLLPERDALLLEAAASERLFGAPERLGARLERELDRLGYRAAAGSAATPEAAWVAAGERRHVPPAASLRRELGATPLRALYLDAARVTAMERMGFRRLRDLLRLPARALTRRFGPDLPDYLDRLLGVRPDPRRFYRPPERFASRLDLPAEIHDRQALLFPLKRLLGELCGVLRGGDAAVQSLTITLGHEDHPDTALALGLQSPSREPERLLGVLRERLERLQLPQAVRDVRLEASRLLTFSAGQAALFRDTPADRRQDIEQLAERLQARLGDRSVTGLAGVEDHRPEYSWRHRALHEPAACVALAQRPAWLLPQPKPCAVAELEILSGPERIESGWWDGRDCRRDYFVARDRDGRVLWVFREYKPRRGWFLHGVFA